MTGAPSTLKEIEARLNRVIGLDVHSLGSSLIALAVRTRMKKRGIVPVADYAALLEGSASEWQAFVEEIVVPETWFFRDRQPFFALSDWALREWLPNQPYNVLRILSSPCSTGEEPYSIVMALLDAGLAPERFAVEAVDISDVALAKARGHAASQLSVKPSMANLVLWRSLYVHDGRVQADAFHLGVATRHYPGESALLLDIDGARQVAAGDAKRLQDLERFRVFSDGFLVLDKFRPGFVGDARYAMQPTAIAPIWGLEWRAAGVPTEFVTRHDFSPAMRRDFLAMLLGR